MKPLFRRLREGVKTLKARALGFHRNEEGAGTVAIVFFMIAGAALLAFAVDATRVTSDASRLKQATDAAAAAVTLEHAKDADADVNEMAERYVASNLGLDLAQLNRELTVTVEPVTWKDYSGYRVRAAFRAKPVLIGAKSRSVEVSSAAVAVYHPMEVSFVVPSTMNEEKADMEAITEIGEDFFDRMIEGRNDRWMALVPYSDGVNVWDTDRGIARIRDWAMSDRLQPSWFRYIRSGAGVANMASPRMPDIRMKILHVRRGMRPGEIFHWEDAPSGSFEISAQTCGGGNCIMSNYGGAWPYIEWSGPVIPSLGNGLTGPTDQRHIAADNTVPLTALLPLTDSRETFRERLSKLVPDHETMTHAINMNIAIGWGAMALSPGFRGVSGWGDSDHPIDFSEDADTPNTKAIVMLANLNGPLLDIDMDSNNHYLDIEGLGGKEDTEDSDFERQRIEDLCDSFKTHRDFHFYLLMIPPSTEESGKTRYEELWPTLERCARTSGAVQLVKTQSFARGKGMFKQKLSRIAADLESKSTYVRLIE